MNFSFSTQREDRLIPLMKALHRLVYVRTKRALLVKDHVGFALRVAQIYTSCHPDEEMEIKEEYLQFLLKVLFF